MGGGGGSRLRKAARKMVTACGSFSRRQSLVDPVLGDTSADATIATATAAVCFCLSFSLSLSLYFFFCLSFLYFPFTVSFSLLNQTIGSNANLICIFLERRSDNWRGDYFNVIFFSFCLENIVQSVCISLGQCCDLEKK